MLALSLARHILEVFRRRVVRHFEKKLLLLRSAKSMQESLRARRGS